MFSKVRNISYAWCPAVCGRLTSLPARSPDLAASPGRVGGPDRHIIKINEQYLARPKMSVMPVVGW